MRWEGGVGVDVLWGAETSGKWSPSVNQGRSTDRNEGLWAGSPSVFMPWTSAPDREVSTGSRPHLILWGKPLSPHTVIVDTLLVGRDVCMHSYWACHQSWCLGAPL